MDEQIKGVVEHAEDTDTSGIRKIVEALEVVPYSSFEKLLHFNNFFVLFF